MKNTRFEWLNEIGGFLFWLLIKFGKTNLEEEQSIKNVPRNILMFCLSIFLICLINYKFWRL